MNYREFARQCYLRSVPSVDLATTENTVDCTAHRLLQSEYEKLLKEFGVEPHTDEMLACNMFMLRQGPKLVNNL